jgi:tRNA threonylcarbamoyladenosine biosynthesis protein TsaE
VISVETKSAAQTQALGRSLAEIVKNQDIVLLVGDLGAGKTTFTKGFAAALGVAEPVTSPTFVLVRSYVGRLKLHHADVYRLEDLQEVVDLGLLELLDDGGVALIEWGDMAEAALPRDYLKIRLSFDPDLVDGDERRSVEFEFVGTSWAARESAIRSLVAQSGNGEGNMQ